MPFLWSASRRARPVGGQERCWRTGGEVSSLRNLQLRPRLAFGELVAKFSGQFVLLTFDRLVELLLKRWADAVLFA